jgi:hypothetical protein
VKLNRKQLIAYLNLIHLKGIDDEVKMRKLVNDVVLNFTDDGIHAFGVDDTENLIFNHIYHIDYVEENEDPEVIVIKDITKWLNYLSTFNDDVISLSVADSKTTVSSKTSYYSLPLHEKTTVKSFQRSGGEPLIPYDESTDWYQIFKEDSEEPSTKEDWCEYKFNQSVLMQSIDSGRNVDTMNTKLFFSKNNIELHVGDIKDPATPSFRNESVEGTFNSSWTFKAKEKKEWSCEVGLHSVIGSIGLLLNKSDPSLYFKDPTSNIIIRSNDSTLEGSKIITTWAIGTPEEDDTKYGDEEDEE